MKLNEITRRGPGDYWPGDEYNPGSPDYDETAGRRRLPTDSRDDDYISDRDREEDRRTKGIAAAAKRQIDNTYGRLESGEKNGQPYNIVVTFTGNSADEAGRAADSWLRHNQNIYMQSRPAVERDGNAVTMYAMLDKHHLYYLQVQRETQQ